jgi:hypothetical protein
MVRIDPRSNYKSVFFNGKTVRQKIDPSRPITAPRFAEIEDVAINSKCFANCPYCYTSATKSGNNFDDIVGKALDVWGSVSQNERPFQIAIGGAGESTIHPDWVPFVKTVREMGIVPNYTTNGMHLTPKVVNGTVDYCGGVAISYHPHLKEIFNSSIKKLSFITRKGLKLNTHLIIGDQKSLFDAQAIYETYKDEIDYFVMLPYQVAGRATSIETDQTWKEMFIWIDSLPLNRQKQFAFGALFYEWMLQNQIPLKIDIYEPDIYSGYRIFDESYKLLRKSSYNLTPKFEA